LLVAVIKVITYINEGANTMTTVELLPLLLKFVNTNSDVVDIQWDGRMSPRLLLNPYSKNLEERKIAAHYFLLVSSMLEDGLIGFSENARRLLAYLHKAFGNRLFEIYKPHLLEEKIVKCGFYDALGPSKQLIAEILTSVNTFVKSKAERNLLEYSQGFSKPKDLVEDLSQNIEKMGGPYKNKAWTYMRWMVRPHPDLRILDHFSPEDLYVPLTVENAHVAVSLGLINSPVNYLFRDENRAMRSGEIITRFAKKLFPKDPAKVDYPFFLIGRWLKQKNLNTNTLKEALQFFDYMNTATGHPQSHYQKLSRYKSGWEKETAKVLSNLRIQYSYEAITFPLPGDKYTPDFILDKSLEGRRIVLEPHFEMTPRQARKYALFKRTYGQEFLLILLLKNDLISYYHERKVLTDDVADDVWPIEFVHLLAEKIKRGTYGQ
jgi:hypothetical protein